MECPDSETIVKAITSLGEGLGMPVTAEGVETKDVLDRLKGYGRYKAQGYYYGRPQPASETSDMLAEQNLLSKPVPEPDVAPPTSAPEDKDASTKRSA
jgi:EAL domain-containing protein (putative c-di-GMP-specific phosphodiesterase class I)